MMRAESIPATINSFSTLTMTDYEKDKSDIVSDGVYPVLTRLEGDVTEEGIAMANDPHR